MWRNAAPILAAGLLAFAGCSMISQKERADAPPEATEPTAAERAWMRSQDSPATRPSDPVGELNAAVADVQANRFDEARPRLADLVGRFERRRDAVRAAEALFWLSYCYEKVGRVSQAQIFYQRVVDRYPETNAAEQAITRLEQLQPRRAGEP
jgi:TolA-binding protein